MKLRQERLKRKTDCQHPADPARGLHNLMVMQTFLEFLIWNKVNDQKVFNVENFDIAQ